MSMAGRLLKVGIDIRDGNLALTDGSIIANNSVGIVGKMFYVDAANGDDNNDGQAPDRAVQTIATGYGLLTANRHDTLVLLSGASAFTISDTLTWAKAYTHMIGVAAPTPNARARIDISGTDSAVAGLTVTADGCMFSNFRIQQSTSYAACGAIEVTGDRNYFYNVDIQGIVGTLALANANSFSLELNGAEECRFEKCTIGIDTVVRTEGAHLRIDGAAARNEFIDCFFRSACETAAKSTVKIVDTTGIDRSLLFKNCVFYNFYTNHGAKLNEVFTVPANTQTHDIILINCWAVGYTEWESNDRGQMFMSMSVPTAEDGGIVLEPINT